MQETPAALLDQLVYIDNFFNNSDTPNLDADGQLSLDLAAFADEAFVFADEEKPNKPFSDDDDHAAANDPQEGTSWLNHNEILGGNLRADSAKLDDHDGPGGLGIGPEPIDADVSHLDDFSEMKSNWTATERNPQNHFSAYSISDKSRTSKLGKRTSQNNNGHSPPPPNVLEAPRQSIPDLSNIPKFPVPPGAEMSLKQAGLSLNQIDLLSALIAQHQTSVQVSPATTSSRGEGLRAGVGSSEPSVASSQASGQSSTFNSTGITRSFPTHSLNHDAGTIKTESPSSVNGSEYSSSGSVSGHQTPTHSSSSILAELDKRRRSLAASARFRIKKKMKEKELEEQISLLNDLVRNFELKIDELELENRLLKNLIIEKGNQNSDEELKLLKERAKRSSKR
ncbi:hypothetical protein PUMCH_002490 [Australozyma saopauloensis]|uniref:BZIP domain-containing protein n=1 Tax=Australozyma saopauloensis TaxID=291208 RepID=A0AAX4H9S6_9ASCO|nr:hypothetical protein PUMCH_002490 [[Candida] saopauloensis]